MKVTAYLSIGFANANHEEVLELPDDLTEAEVEQEVRDWKDNYVEWSYVRTDIEKGKRKVGA